MLGKTAVLSIAAGLAASAASAQEGRAPSVAMNWTAPPAGQTCEAARKILASSTRGFADLRGKRHGDLTTWDGLVLAPHARNCEAEAWDGAPAAYKCEYNRLARRSPQQPADSDIAWLTLDVVRKGLQAELSGCNGLQLQNERAGKPDPGKDYYSVYATWRDPASGAEIELRQTSSQGRVYISLGFESDDEN